MTPFLRNMYQQWQCGQREAYIRRWEDFALLASKHSGMSYDDTVTFLKTCTWFKWKDSKYD